MTVQALMKAREAAGEPVVFVDGVLVNGTPSAIAEKLQGTIEKVEVTKGEAARRMIGEAGADGILQITTKKGAAGELRAVQEEDFVRQQLAEEQAAKEEQAWTVTGDMPPGVSDTLVMTGVTKLEKAPGHVEDDMVVTVDGKPFHGDVSTLDVSTIDHVEVIKGGTTGKGSIHITTKKAAGGGGD